MRTKLHSVPKMSACILLCLILSSCLMYGRPNSRRTQLLGRHMKNFVDATNRERGEVRLNSDHLILYTANSSLYLMNTKNGIATTITEIAPKQVIRWGVIIPDRNLAVYAIQDRNLYLELENGFAYPVSLTVYDYEKRHLLFRGRLFETYQVVSKGPSFEVFLTDHRSFHLSELHYPGRGQRVYAEIDDTVTEVKNNRLVGRTYFRAFHIGDDSIAFVGEYSDAEAGEWMRQSDIQTGWKYLEEDGNDLRVFTVEPFSDYLPANYKLEYNGLYIRSKESGTNLRISKGGASISDFTLKPFTWFAGGTRVVHGGMLYDTTGEKRESQIVDGVILDIRPAKASE